MPAAVWEGTFGGHRSSEVARHAVCSPRAGVRLPGGRHQEGRCRSGAGAGARPACSRVHTDGRVHEPRTRAWTGRKGRHGRVLLEVSRPRKLAV